MADGYESQAVAVQDQRRRGDAREGVAHVGRRQDFGVRAGHARRCRAVAGQIPPRAEGVIAGDARRDDLECVEALLDRIRLGGDRHERIGDAPLRADRIVGRPQRTRCAVDDHQAAHPLRVVSGQNQSAHPGVVRCEYRGLLAANCVHHRDCVLGPERWPDHVHRWDAR